MTHLDLLNACLALFLPQPGWPAVLAHAGYTVEGVGVSFPLADGARVVPDIIARNGARETTLLIEVKGGRSASPDQLDRMCRVTAADLRDFAHLPVASLEEHRISCVVLCSEEHVDAIARAASGHVVTVISFDGHRFTLSGERLADPGAADALEALQVTRGAAIPRLVPFDPHSGRDEVARAVVPELVAAIVRGDHKVTVDGVLRRTHHVVHRVMRSTGSGSELRELRRAVKDILKEAASGELSMWLDRERSVPQPTWGLARRLSSDPASRTRELQALQKAGQELVERVMVPELQIDWLPDEDE